MLKTSLPKEIVTEIKLMRNLERDWKSELTKYHNLAYGSHSEEETARIDKLENIYNEQCKVVEEIFETHDKIKRSKVIQMCKGHSTKARKAFWSHVSGKVKKSSNINCAEAKNGIIKCKPHEVREQVEQHLGEVFNGEFKPTFEEGFQREKTDEAEKGYGKTLGKEFTMEELQYGINQLKNGKAKGWDDIPNEFFKNAPDYLLQCLLILFNKVLATGVLPSGWNSGIVTLIHKLGPKEILGNYRPLTVNISISMLYGRLLNKRLVLSLIHI